MINDVYCATDARQMRFLTFDDLLTRLLGWIDQEVYIWVEDAASRSRLVYANGPLHPANELTGEMGNPGEAYAFEVGYARQAELIVHRACFNHATGDNQEIIVQSSSVLIRVGIVPV
jgi:hypothetical protein